MFPYLLGFDDRAELQRLYEAGKILSRSESCRVGIYKDGNYRCISYLEVQKDKYVIAESGIRAQHFPFDGSDVIGDLALSDLMVGLKKGFADPSVFQNGRILDKIIAFHENNFSLVSLRSSGTGASLPNAKP